MIVYTCGSSLDATRIILDLLKRIDQHRDNSELFSLNNLALEREYTKKSENITEKEDLRGTDKDIFAECVINFFYESSSKSALSRDFEEGFFVIKVFTLILKISQLISQVFLDTYEVVLVY